MAPYVAPLTVVFWACLGLSAYVFVGYPAAVALLARLFGRPPRLGVPGGPRPSVSVVIAAFNEERTIGRRIREFTGRIAADGLDGEVIVVSDGSTDRTLDAAREHEADGEVRAIDLVENRGKAVALSMGCAEATRDVIVFADARQTWADDALVALLGPFADPEVGAVSGDLIVEAAPGVMAGVGIYWRYEKWIRANEGRLHSTVGVTGAISAVRRELFRTIPPGTILDDVYWPMQVVLQSRRVVHEGRARAFDRLPEKAGDEFRRKVRTLSGNFQLAARVPALLVPWRNPAWLAFLSHKLGRLAAPWAGFQDLTRDIHKGRQRQGLASHPVSPGSAGEARTRRDARRPGRGRGRLAGAGRGDAGGGAGSGPGSEVRQPTRPTVGNFVVNLKQIDLVDSNLYTRPKFTIARPTERGSRPQRAMGQTGPRNAGEVLARVEFRYRTLCREERRPAQRGRRAGSGR